MPKQSKALQNLLEIEAEIYDELNTFIADTIMEDSDVDALSLQYDRCVKAVLDFSAETIEDVIAKCDFVFTLISRSENETDLLIAMKESLLRDLRNFLDN